MAERMKIGVDLDDTLLDCCSPFVEYLNRRYNTNFSNDELNLENYVSKLNLNGERPERVVDGFLDTEEYKDLKPMPLAVEVITELSGKFDFQVITSRHPRFQRISIRNVNRYFKNNFQSLKLSHNPYVGYSRERGTKGEICKREGIHLMIDDSLKISLDCVTNGVNVLLFNPGEEALNGINGYANNGFIKPVRHWEDVRSALLKL